MKEKWFFSFFNFHCLGWRFLLGFKSTTIIDILSELFRPIAISVRLSATTWAAETPSAIKYLRRLLSTNRAISPASSLLITSHNPSLASIKHSSSLFLVMKVISGTGIIHGLKYRSPEENTYQLVSVFEEFYKCQ